MSCKSQSDQAPNASSASEVGASLQKSVLQDEGLKFGERPVAAGRRDARLKQYGKRYVVGFKDSKKGAAAVHAQGGFVARAFPKLQAVAAYLPEKAVAALQRNPNIEYLEEDGLRFPLAQQIPYGITLSQASSLAETGQGDVTVCIIDSGFLQSHEDLQDANLSFDC